MSPLRQNAFTDLMREALSQGLTRIRFEADLVRYFSADPTDSWIAMTGESPVARGRTGEEALRNLVEQAR